MPINFNTLVKSENTLRQIFNRNFKHVINMHEQIYIVFCSKKTFDNNFLKTMQNLENCSNKFEMELLTEASWVISKDVPRAAHLRFVLAIIRSAKDIERMGDFAYNITHFFCNNKNNDENINKLLTNLLDESIKICKKIHDHVVKNTKNTKKYYIEVAAMLIKRFNEKYIKTLNKFYDLILKDKIQNKNKLFILTIIKYLDRNVDHAYNILENLIYINDPNFYKNNLLK